MNWFQIVFLRENSQGKRKNRNHKSSCELISNCIFTWEFTRKNLHLLRVAQLWIDFKLYFYVRIHKVVGGILTKLSVVNWFQIVFLRENSQEINKINELGICCELISNCIFTWEFTSILGGLRGAQPLWIDFKLYFYVRIHKYFSIFHLSFYVVNWFQIVFLRENSQDRT